MTARPTSLALRNPSRRRLLRGASAVMGSAALGGWPLRALASSEPGGDRVLTPYGVQAGDVLADRAVIWSHADRPARMWVEVADNPEFRRARRLRGPAALPATGHTAKLDIGGLPPASRLYYRVAFEDLEGSVHPSEPVVGSLTTAPRHGPPFAYGRREGVRFVWSGDVAGQGWGINPEIGGMRIFETMRRVQPDFFIHSGDTVYADGPLQEQVALPDGGVWRNIVTPAKRHVAETLEDFRGNYRYNLMDDNLRRFNAEVPIYAQWDDHEVLNNWYPGEMLAGEIYDQTAVDLLAARAHRAFVEHQPVRFGERSRLYRHFPYGPLLDILRVDLRSFRGPNSANRQASAGPETAFFGQEQLRWLKQALLKSGATWKVIASDMPIGLIVRDGERFENGANGDNGGPLGRELEIAELLRFIKRHRIHNVVWLTADVHYTAAHHYHPDRAGFRDFLPFWEFVSGPLNAGTFGPSPLDGTFGPQVVFEKSPPPGRANLPPSAGLQFFGQVDIDAASGVMTVALKDLQGSTLFRQELTPEHGHAHGRSNRKDS